MQVILLLIMAFTGVMFLEVPALIRKKYWRELLVFMVFLSVGFILAFLQIIGIKIPSPLKAFTYLIRDLLHLNYR